MATPDGPEQTLEFKVISRSFQGHFKVNSIGILREFSVEQPGTWSPYPGGVEIGIHEVCATYPGEVSHPSRGVLQDAANNEQRGRDDLVS